MAVSFDIIQQATAAICQQYFIGLEAHQKLLMQAVLLRQEAYLSGYDKAVLELEKHLASSGTAKRFYESMLKTMVAAAQQIDIAAKTAGLTDNRAYHTYLHQLGLGSDVESSGLITQLAAMCHDIIQEKGPIGNELDSAEIFMQKLTLVLKTLEHENLLGSDCLTAYLKHLPFIASELIINATFLMISRAKPNDDLIRNPLIFYVTLIEQLAFGWTENANEVIDTTLSAKQCELYLGATRISAYDTSRCLDQKIDFTRVAKVMDQTPALNLLAEFCKLHGAESLQDRGRMWAQIMQGLRMSPELNEFPNIEPEYKYTPEEVATMMSFFHLRNKEGITVDDLIKHGNNEVCLSIIQKFAKRLPHEKAFARSMNFNSHNILAKAYHAPDIFDSFDNQGWARHCQRIASLEQFFDSLSIENYTKMSKSLLIVASFGQQEMDIERRYRDLIKSSEL